MHPERDDWRNQDFEMPDTTVERIAWALCMADMKIGEGFLSDEELVGLEALLSKMARTCGSEVAEADWLGLPVAAVRRCIPKLRLLARTERSRRIDAPGVSMLIHLTRAFWQDYMGKAEAAWSVAIERSEAAIPEGHAHD